MNQHEIAAGIRNVADDLDSVHADLLRPMLIHRLRRLAELVERPSR